MNPTATFHRRRTNEHQARRTTADSPSLRHDHVDADELVSPSQCDRCVPVIRMVEDGVHVTITEAAHELSCPNHLAIPTGTIRAFAGTA